MSELKSLAAKMAAIMGDVPTMIKNGTNQQQRYQYVTAEDVKAAIRPLLKKHKLAVFSAMLGVDRTAGKSNSGTASMTTIAHMRFTLVCGETGESMACDWFGESTDYGDKSVNKAATAAEKYWLLNTFLLSTTEPEADEETIELVARPEFCEIEGCDEQVNAKAAAMTLAKAGAVMCKRHYTEFAAKLPT